MARGPAQATLLFPDRFRSCALCERGRQKFIVSFGEPKIQRAKSRVAWAGPRAICRKIYYADRGNVLTKEAAFRKNPEKDPAEA